MVRLGFNYGREASNTFYQFAVQIAIKEQRRVQLLEVCRCMLIFQSSLLQIDCYREHIFLEINFVLFYLSALLSS
jgi:hypothetical protein